MAKRITIQKRGKGGPSYTAPSHRYMGKLSYPSLNEPITGEILDLVHSVGHTAPLMIVEFDDGQVNLLPAPIGVRVGQIINTLNNKPQIGDILRLRDIPTGKFVCNIENRPGDRGKLLRCCGAGAQIITKESKRVIVKMSSKKKKEFSPNCFATVGIIAGAGKTNKPIIKAGKAHHIKRATNSHFPLVKGVAMNVCNHPHGGTHRRNLGRPTAIKRGTPAGRKSGLIAARRTGRKKK